MKRFFYLISALAVAFAFTACENKEEGEPAGDPTLTLNPATLEFSGWAETQSVEIEANRAWTAEVSDESWLTISPESYPSSGKLTKVNVAVTVTANETDSSREGYVVFYLDGVEAGFLEVLQKTKADSEKPEDEDPYPISWMNYQWTTGERITEGEMFEASCCVFADGLTNAVESETGENIRCDIGYTTGDTEPWEEGWTWQECYFNGDWGDNFHFQVKVLDLAAGEYTYTFRAYKVETEEYKYAGNPEGLYDGVDHLFKKIYVSAGEMEDPFDYTGKEVTWANLQWYDKSEINVGEFFDAGTKVLIPGITDHEEIPGFDTSNITVEIGISLTETDPASETGWTWTPAKYNGDWGAEYFYQAKTDPIEVAGTYNYTFRIKLADNEYVYAGTDGLWDGSGNLTGTFTVVDPNAVPEEPEEPEVPEFDFAALSVSWAHLQWIASAELELGGVLDAGVKVFVDGLTNSELEAGYGKEQFEVELGYGSEGDPSGSSWVWKPISYSDDWGSEYYFQGQSDPINVAGTYYYSFRIKYAGKDYVYAGNNGLWNADTNPCLTVTVAAPYVEPEQPGENEFAAYSVTWANVQWWASDALASGDQFDAGAKVFVPGLTDANDSYATEQFEVELGYGTESTPTGSSWVWSSVAFNADWGNEYYFQGKTQAITTPGTYYCSFRIKFAGKDYVYADLNGLWDGTSALSKTFTVSE